MSDILDEAKSLADSMENCPDFSEEQQMIRRLVAEIERLREIAKYLEIEAEDSGSMAVRINGKIYYSVELYNEKVDQLAAWQKIAIEERAIRYCRSTGTKWKGLEEFFRAEYREIAAQELQLETTNEDVYVERLEKAFLELDESHTICKGLLIGRKDGKTAKELAQATLSKIREGQA